MHQALLTRLEFYLCAYGQYVHYLAEEHAADFYIAADIVYHALGGSCGFSIGGGDKYPAVILKVDLYAGRCDDAVYGLSAGSDYLAYLIGVYAELHDARSIGGQVCPGLLDGLCHLVQYEQTAPARLLKGAGKYLLIYALYLYIHLNGGDALAGAGYLKVHIAKEVLKALYVGQYGDIAGGIVLDETHRNARYGLLYGDASVHKRKSAGAD